MTRAIKAVGGERHSWSKEQLAKVQWEEKGGEGVVEVLLGPEKYDSLDVRKHVVI